MQELNSVALVTDGAQGIGRETARQLAEVGVHTILLGRDHEGVLTTARELQVKGLPVVALPLDVSDEPSIAMAANTVQRRHGRLDILINSTGFVADAGDAAERPTFDIHLQALIAMTQAFLPLLHRSSDGCIINLAAGAEMHSPPASSPLASRTAPCRVARSALNAWTLHLAHELRGTAVRVHSVVPGQTGVGSMDVVEGARTGVKLALFGAIV